MHQQTGQTVGGWGSDGWEVGVGEREYGLKEPRNSSLNMIMQ